MLIELAQIRTQELGKWNEFTGKFCGHIRGQRDIR